MFFITRKQSLHSAVSLKVVCLLLFGIWNKSVQKAFLRFFFFFLGIEILKANIWNCAYVFEDNIFFVGFQAWGDERPLQTWLVGWRTKRRNLAELLHVRCDGTNVFIFFVHIFPPFI